MNNKTISFKIKTKTLTFFSKVVLVTIVVLFILKLLYIKDFLMIISTFVFESAFFLLILLLFSSKKKILKILFYFFYLINFIISIINTYFLEDIINRRYSLYNLNSEYIGFFFKEILPIKIIFIFFVSLIFIFVVSRLLKIKIKTICLNIAKKYLFVINLIILSLILCFMTFILPGFSHPIINTAEDIFYFSKGSIEVYNPITINKLITDSQIKELNKEIIEYPKNKIKYDYIFLFVGETVTEQSYLKSLEENSFFSQKKENSLYFNNYYTNNQDSRTALMVLLSSIFIPYESYINDWVQLYDQKLVSRHNLVDYFNINDYNTVFAISSIETPAIGKHNNWYNNININNKEEYDLLKDNYVCLHIEKYQRGCEDMTILPKVKEVIDSSKKLFLLQEFVFGHNTKYMSLKKQSLMEYYSNYLLEFYKYLEEKDIIDKSLIIFVGDHGSKSYKLMKKQNAYKVPLIFIGNNIKNNIDSGLYSHIDFKDLLFNNILEKYNKKIDNNFTYVVGATNSSFIGYIDTNGFILYNTFKKIVVTDTINDNKINYRYNLFYSYRKYFEKI